MSHLFGVYIVRPDVPRRPTAIFFDFDGVLVKSEPLHFQAASEVASANGLSLSEAQFFDDYYGTDDRTLFAQLLTNAGRTPSPGELLKIVTQKRETASRLVHHQRDGAMPGVEEAVRSLWRHYPLGVCSGAQLGEIELMLDRIGLRDCFKVIVSAEDVTVGKPDPQCYKLAAERMSERLHQRITPRSCVVIEDAPRVIDRLKPLGFVCVGVTTQLPADRFNNADYTIASVCIEQIKQNVPILELFDNLIARKQ